MTKFESAIRRFKRQYKNTVLFDTDDMELFEHYVKKIIDRVANHVGGYVSYNKDEYSYTIWKGDKNVKVAYALPSYWLPVFNNKVGLRFYCSEKEGELSRLNAEKLCLDEFVLYMEDIFN